MTHDEHYRQAEDLLNQNVGGITESLVYAVYALTHAVLSLREAPPPVAPPEAEEEPATAEPQRQRAKRHNIVGKMSMPSADPPNEDVTGEYDRGEI